MKVAVVTPYYKESPHILMRCIESVLAQTHANVHHYLVADGFPQPETIPQHDSIHMVDLPNAHRDYGCTPRSVGAMCALGDDCDVVCFLDADNLYTPEHVESVVRHYALAQQQQRKLDAVFAFRHVFLPGYEHLRLVDPEEGNRTHVDTSCFSFSKSAAHIWPMWGLIPRGWTPVCDRIMLNLVKLYQLSAVLTEQHTVLYESNWRIHYETAGLPIPTSGLHDDTLKQVTEPSRADIEARFRIRQR